MEEHENEDSIDSDLSLHNSDEENRKTVVINFNANSFKKDESPIFKKDVQDNKNEIINNSFVNTIEKVLPSVNETKECTNIQTFSASDSKSNLGSNTKSSNFCEEDSSIKNMRSFFNRSVSFRTKHKMRFNKEEITSSDNNLQENYQSNKISQDLNLDDLSENKPEGENIFSEKNEGELKRKFHKYNSVDLSDALTKFNLEEKADLTQNTLQSEHKKEVVLDQNMIIQELDKSMEHTLRRDDFIKNVEINSRNHKDIDNISDNYKHKSDNLQINKIEKLQEDLLKSDPNKSDLPDEKIDEELEDDVRSLSKSSSPQQEDSEDFDKYSITDTPRVEITERKFNLEKDNTAVGSQNNTVSSSDKSLVNNLAPLEGEAKVLIHSANKSQTEQTIINNNYNININLSKNDVDEDTEMILRRISSKMRFSSKTSKENLTINQEHVLTNEYKTENPRGSGIVKRLNLTNVNETKNNDANSKPSKHLVIEEKIDKIEYNSTSKADELKRRIRSSIIDKLMHENSYLEEGNPSGQSEADQIEEKIAEEAEDSNSKISEEKSLSYSSYEECEYNSEENDSIVDLNDGDFNGSFLKEMLIETNRQYIKDKVSNDDKIKEAASRALFDIIYLKIKAINIYSFLRIQSYNKLKIRNYKIPLINCFKIANFRRIENVRSNFRKYRRINEYFKKADENKDTEYLKNFILEMGISKNSDNFNNHIDLAKILNVKIYDYLKKNDKLIDFKSENCIKLEFQGVNKEYHKIQEEISSNIQKIPNVPCSEIRNIPNIPSVPGVSIPSVPKVPLGNIPSIPSIPGVSIPQVPKMNGNNIISVPSVVPNIPNIPNAPNIQNVPTIPKIPTGFPPQVPGSSNIPSIPQAPINSGIPSIPKIPSIPGIPGQRPPVPQIPSAPSTIPSIPGIPGLPRPPVPGSIPSLPGVPGLPRMPTVPSMPGVPGLPRLPGAPSIPGAVRPGPPVMPGFPIGLTSQTGPIVVIPKPPKDTNPKKIFWNMIPKNKLQSTFWIKEKLETKVDYDNLCKYFCEPKKKAEDKKTGGDSKQESTAPVNTVVKILDDKRLMNLAIALSKVAITNENLKNALENFEEEKLTLEMIDKIISLAPNSEEIEKLRDYKGDTNLISNGEKFCMALMSVNRFMSRLECIKYKKIINAEKDEIVNKIKVLREGIISIKGSKNFKSVLKCIITIGNYLNSDTAKGNAQGVSINTLAMLEGVKGIGKEKYTLLDFLVINIKSKEPSLINFYKDFSNLEEVLGVDISDIESKIKEFENGLKKLKKEKESIDKEKDKSLVANFSTFVNDLELLACDKFDEILTTQDSLTKEINDTIEFFGEEAKQFKIGDFLKLINDFVENFKKTSTKLSAEEAKQLKKQIKDDKNKKEETKNKHNKELEKIRKTAVKKTLARKSNYKNFSHLMNKDKLREIVKSEESEQTNNVNSCLSPNLASKNENSIDKNDKHTNLLGKPEEVLSKSPNQMNKKMISLENHIIPVLIKETKERVTKARLTKARVTKFKKPTFDEHSDDSCGDDEIETDFLKINKPLKSNNLSKMNQSKNDYLITNVLILALFTFKEKENK